MSPRRAAQALVEFAVVMPILLIFILGVLDVGRGVVAASSIANASREGARAAVVNYPAPGWDAEASSRARSAAVAIDSSLLSVAVSTEAQGGDTLVNVALSYPFRPVAPMVTMVASEIPLSAGARMLARGA